MSPSIEGDWVSLPYHRTLPTSTYVDVVRLYNIVTGENITFTTDNEYIYSTQSLRDDRLLYSDTILEGVSNYLPQLRAFNMTSEGLDYVEDYQYGSIIPLWHDGDFAMARLNPESGSGKYQIGLFNLNDGTNTTIFYNQTYQFVGQTVFKYNNGTYGLVYGDANGGIYLQYLYLPAIAAEDEIIVDVPATQTVAQSLGEQLTSGGRNVWFFYIFLIAIIVLIVVAAIYYYNKRKIYGKED